MSDSLTTQRTIDPVLTTIAQGYGNQVLVAESLFPIVGISYNKAKVPVFNKTAFILRNTSRARGANSNIIPATDYSFIDIALNEYDIAMELDYSDADEGNYIKYQTKITQDLKDVLALGKEKQAADLALNVSSYGSSAYNSETTPFSSGTTDPISIVKSCMEDLRSKIGRKPNTALISAKVYSALLDHPQVIERVKYSGMRKVNTTILSELFDIPVIKIGYAQQLDGNGAFSDIWGDNIVLAYVDEAEKTKRSEFNPSYGYTFQKSGKPEVDTYYKNGGKVQVLRCTDNYSLKVTCQDAGFLIYNCLA
jgi:hypothetical protein